MSIITKRGDDGQTDCLYGKRAYKSSIQIEAIGCLDELNAWIGLANKAEPRDNHAFIQRTLVQIMGELSAGIVNFEKYAKQFQSFESEISITRVEAMVELLEKDTSFADWANPSSHWDVACRICRRAERTLWKYREESNNREVRQEVLIYINRLSDLLWIWGRK